MNVADLSGTTSFRTPGYAHTTGYADAFGNFATGSATTIVTHLRRTRSSSQEAQLSSQAIRMSNHEKELEEIGMVING